MEITLYLPYLAQTVSDNNLENYYNTDKSYVEALRNEYEESKDYVFNAMVNGTLQSDKRADAASFMMPVTSENNLQYSSCKAYFISEDGSDETIDTMITHMAKQELFIVEIVLDYGTIEEEFESDVNEWDSVTKKVMEHENKMGEDWVLKNMPKRDLKISFLNKSNKKVFMEMKNCQLLERQVSNKVVVLVERIYMIDDFLNN